MSVDLVSVIPFSFSITGAPDGLPLAAYPFGGYNSIYWSLDIRVENEDAETDDISPNGFIFSLPGQRPEGPPGGFSDHVTKIQTISTSIGAVVTVTATYELMPVSEGSLDMVANGNLHVLVESDIPLTVQPMTTEYGGFTVGMVGFDENVVEWDPVPSFSEDPGVIEETPLDTDLYEISFIPQEDSSEWFEEINLLVDDVPSGSGGGAPTVSDAVRLRCWQYSLDGHDYYIIRVGSAETLVYDLTTGQWAHWLSPNEVVWRAHIGTNWVGMRDTLISYPTDVVAGDDRTGQLWLLDPTAGMDDNQVTGTPEPFNRVVIGGTPLDGRATAPCNAVTLSAALGAPVDADATIELETSDDLGKTWLSHGTITLVAGEWDAVPEWRALGTMRAPGRIFRLTDNGATVRIGSLDLR